LLRLEQQTLEDAASVLPMSPMVQRQITRRDASKPQVMLPLPLLEQAASLRWPGRRLRGQSPEDPLRVLHCGRDPLRHGAAAAVDWFRCLAPRGIHARLDLWAKTIAHAERAIGAPAAELEKESVFLHPWNGGFRAALADADLLFHPTLYDSFSLVCLEAAACGVPVVTTASAGVAELLPIALCATEPREMPEVAAARGMELLVGASSMTRGDWEELVEGVRTAFDLGQHVGRLESVLEELHP
jgi:glycosyltransferase involved in cell wall biosynthesis